VKIKDVMTSDVKTVEPATSLKDVAALLVERRVSGLPVVDPDGKVLGVISEGDILFKECGEQGPQGVLAWLLEPGGPAKLEATTAEEAMTAPAKTIGPERPVVEAAKRMLEEAVNRFPRRRRGRHAGRDRHAGRSRSRVRALGRGHRPRDPRGRRPEDALDRT